MSLDDRLRAARPVGDAPPIDLDAMLHGAMRSGRRRRRTWRATAAAGVALILLLISIPIVRNLSQQETDVADRIQKEKKNDQASPVPTAKVPPGSGPRTGPSSIGGGAGRERSRGSTTKVPPAVGAATASIDRIAFVSVEPSTDIYTMNLDGSAKKRLGAGIDPDWSPDGKRIAFSRGRTDAGCTSTTARVDPPDPCDIWVMDADGSDQRRLAPGWSPDWSPDGRRIAYAAGQDNSELHVMNADGSDSTRITQTPNTSPSTQASNSPSWSPDGRQIAFARRTKCGETCWTHHISVVRPDGSELRSLGAQGYEPAWSPDGASIAYSWTGAGDSDIFTITVDGEETSHLTQDEPGASPMDNYDGSPNWSPDGRIAFIQDPDGPSGAGACHTTIGCGTGGPAPPRMSVMNADGSGVIDIGEGRMPDFAPSE